MRYWSDSLVKHSHFTFHSPSESRAAANDDEDSEDDDYAPSDEGDISLGSEDTDISDGEIDDIEQEADKMSVSARKKPATPGRNKGKNAAKNPPTNVQDLAQRMSKASLEPGNDFSFKLPKILYHCSGG